MQKTEERTVSPVLGKDGNGEIDYEVICKGFPELTITYIEEKDTTYVLAWKRYVFGEFQGDQRKTLKEEIKKQIYSWVLKLAMFTTYHEIESIVKNSSKTEQDGK